MRDVYVLGVHMIKFGRYPEKTVPELGAESVIGALKDAGMTMSDIEIMVVGNLYQSNAMVGQRIMQIVGQTGIPVVNVTNACATGSTAFREAYFGVASGAYDVAMATGVEQMGKMGLLSGGGPGISDPAYSTEGVLGTGIMPGVFGMAGVEHMRKYGTKLETFAQISVKNHKHAMNNPLSQYQVEVSLEDVMNSRMVAYPNTLYMCCPTGDGSAAAVLVSEEKARQYTSHPIKVAASILTSDPYTQRDPTMHDINTLTRNASQQAYEKAGIGPEDLDLIELHDCFATAELLHYENLGIAADGEGPKLVAEGDTSVGGKIPVNASGGLLSKGHPLGATGVANVYEIVQHLRGNRGAGQVEGAKVGLAHVIGLGSACTIQILTA
ncbi:MAG: thiolase family protein [Dehalococcoidia bacterium]|nr:thiolase family protein [Dehalococcoidia bacterium]